MYHPFSLSDCSLLYQQLFTYSTQRFDICFDVSLGAFQISETNSITYYGYYLYQKIIIAMGTTVFPELYILHNTWNLFMVILSIVLYHGCVSFCFKEVLIISWMPVSEFINDVHSALLMIPTSYPRGELCSSVQTNCLFVCFSLRSFFIGKGRARKWSDNPLLICIRYH